jgi:site-specific recombinase XerD
MTNRTLTSPDSGQGLSARKLSELVTTWQLDGEIARHSPQTLALRRLIFGKLAWFMTDRESTDCDSILLRHFLEYVANGHRDPRGRWGNPQNNRAATPGTVATYARHLRAFFAWAVKYEYLPADPMQKIPHVVDRPDDVKPFSPEQVRALLEAAKRSKESARNYALLLFLADSACRVSEACGLRYADLDFSTRLASVEGKGGKRRQVPFSASTARALLIYVQKDGRDPQDAVFESEQGGPMTRNSVRLLFRRLAKDAGITGQCSPHVMRHFAATSFLRNGGQSFGLQRLLGHTSLLMTRRYSDVVDSDVARQHREASPVESLLRGRR